MDSSHMEWRSTTPPSALDEHQLQQGNPLVKRELAQLGHQSCSYADGHIDGKFQWSEGPKMVAPIMNELKKGLENVHDSVEAIEYKLTKIPYELTELNEKIERLEKAVEVGGQKTCISVNSEVNELMGKVERIVESGVQKVTEVSKVMGRIERIENLLEGGMLKNCMSVESQATDLKAIKEPIENPVESEVHNRVQKNCMSTDSQVTELKGKIERIEKLVDGGVERNSIPDTEDTSDDNSSLFSANSFRTPGPTRKRKRPSCIPMTDEHREEIKRHTEQLQKSLAVKSNLSAVLTRLRQVDVLTAYDVDVIQHKGSTPMENASELLNIIPTKGDRAFKEFKKALDIANIGHNLRLTRKKKQKS